MNVTPEVPFLMDLNQIKKTVLIFRTIGIYLSITNCIYLSITCTGED